MSDTPRTDYEIEVNQLDRFEADWPRKLERECNELRRQLDAARAMLESWKAEEGADAKRLEFLIERAAASMQRTWTTKPEDITREAIDAAMKAEQNEH